MNFLSLLLLMQAQSPAVDPRPAPWPDPEREMPGGGFVDAGPTAEARQAMTRFGACVAEESTEKVASTLVRDFRTREFRNALSNLARANEGCARRAGLRGTLRMEGLPFAAALAEAMLFRDPSPLNARLAKAAIGPARPSYSPSDAIAMCVAKSTPDDVAALFATDPGSDAEEAAIVKVEQVAKLCGKDTKLELSATGLRSIVATASYRLVAGQDF